MSSKYEKSELVFAILSVAGATAACATRGDVPTVETLARYYSSVAEVIAGAEGRVIKLIGDGIVVVFPASRVRVAIEAVRLAQERATTLWERFDERCRVQVKIGIGALVLGLFGPRHQEREDVYGDALNQLFKLPTGDDVWRYIGENMPYARRMGLRTTVKVLLVIFLLVSCTTTSNRSSSSNAQHIRSLYDAFGRGDIPTVLGALDLNVEWIEPENTIFGDRHTFQGPKAVAENVFMRIPKDWDNFRLTVDRVIDGGDTVAVQGRYYATSKSTGQPLNAQYVHVWDIRDGKIVRLQVYTDTAQFMRVSGMR